jgi:hypothetical protein
LSDNEPDSKPDLEEELLSVWQRLSLKQLQWTLVAVIMVITAAYGGLQTAHHVTPVSFGQTYDDGPLRITPHSVAITDHRAGLVPLSSKCRYLVLNATIQSTADDSVPFPLPGILGGAAGDCAPHTVGRTEMFGIAGITGQFAATFRGHESITIPSIEPGFTYDYSVVWVVSAAELRRHPQISIRFYRMEEFISAFRIDRFWTGDGDHYGELRITDLESS